MRSEYEVCCWTHLCTVWYLHVFIWLLVYWFCPYLRRTARVGRTTSMSSINTARTIVRNKIWIPVSTKVFLVIESFPCDPKITIHAPRTTHATFSADCLFLRLLLLTLRLKLSDCSFQNAALHLRTSSLLPSDIILHAIPCLPSLFPFNNLRSPVSGCFSVSRLLF